MLSNELYYVYIFLAAIVTSILATLFYFVYKKKYGADPSSIFRNYVFPLISPIFKSIIIWSDSNGKILLANSTASELLKISQQDFIGASLNKILPEEDIKKLRIALPGQIVNFQTELTAKNGEKITTEITAIKAKILEIDWGYFISADSHMQELIILENKLLAQQKLSQQYIAQLEKLENILKNIFSKTQKTSIEVLTETTTALHDFFGAYITICWQSETEENFQQIAKRGLIKLTDENIQGQLLPKNEIMQTITSRKTVIVETSALDEPLQTFLAGEGVFAVVLVPYFNQENKIGGILEFYLQNKIGFEENKKLFNTLSVLITILYILLGIKISSSEEVKKIQAGYSEKFDLLSKKLRNCETDLKDLQGFQQVAIGRELEMVALKNRIKQLEDGQ